MGFTYWLPISAHGPTVSNKFPTKKLIWEKYKILQWEGLKEERKDRITILRLSSNQVWSVPVLQALPQVQETLVSLSVDILPLAWDIMVLVMEGGCWTLGLDRPGGRFHLELKEKDSGELFPCLL